ncbi:MAG: histidine kinase N-terminal 7TM domain-containing protein, partial [Chloroflexota bacterium]|nr:histidine kinase N-terminal 7TM domain-containing protein [Chloroflexota bacterium]
MTAWQSNPYSILLFLSVILSSGLAILVWQKRREKYGVLLLSICLAAGIWSFGYAMELGSATLESKLFWAKIQYLGIPIIPILLLMVMLQYTGYSKLLTRRNIILSLIEPIIVTVLFWTNESHKLIWANWELSSQWSTTTLEAEFGGVLWIHLTLAYLALLISVILLILVYRNAEKIYRRQISVMLLGVSFPLIVSVLYIFNISPF